MAKASLQLCDTHSHIHDDSYPLPANQVLPAAAAAGVTRVVTLASNLASASQAIKYVEVNDGRYGVKVRACVGVYPHETGDFTLQDLGVMQAMLDKHADQICGIGEIGLDYHSNEVGRNQQIAALEGQIQLAIDNDLPMSFHVRSGDYGDAFADFWPVLDNFGGLAHGVLHSFADSMANLDKVLDHGLYVGVNGISTFNKDPELEQVFTAIPLDRLLFETDAPYLAPRPYRGQTNQPAYIRQIADQMAVRRQIDVAELAKITTANTIHVYSRLA